MKKYLVENSARVAYVQIMMISIIQYDYELMLFKISQSKKLMHYWQRTPLFIVIAAHAVNAVGIKNERRISK